MRKWHTNKTRPIASKCMDIIVIWKDGNLTIDTPNIDEFGEWYMLGFGDSYGKESWGNVYKWAYVDKFFEKELKELKNE